MRIWRESVFIFKDSVEHDISLSFSQHEKNIIKSLAEKKNLFHNSGVMLQSSRSRLTYLFQGSSSHLRLFFCNKSIPIFLSVYFMWECEMYVATLTAQSWCVRDLTKLSLFNELFFKWQMRENIEKFFFHPPIDVTFSFPASKFKGPFIFLSFFPTKCCEKFSVLSFSRNDS